MIYQKQNKKINYVNKSRYICNNNGYKLNEQQLKLCINEKKKKKKRAVATTN